MKIKISNLSKAYNRTPVLDGLNLELDDRQPWCLMSPSGSGKTTLLRLLLGLEQPDQGQISFLENGAVLNQPPRFSTVFQENRLCEAFSPVDNLALAAQRTVSREELQRELALLLPKDCLTRPVYTFSGGMKRRTAICRAMVAPSRIIVMDEPTSAITDSDKERLFELIAELKKQDVAIVYITHRMAEIFQIADEITVLRDGEHVKTTSLEGVKEDDIVRWMVGRDLGNIFKRSRRKVGEVVLEVKHLTRKGVFEDVNFKVHAGEVVGVSGLIGAGRTEVMRCVFGLDKYDSGQILFLGKPVSFKCPMDAIRQGIGYVPEDRRRESIIPRMSVLDNMALASLTWLNKKGFVQNAKITDTYMPYVDKFSIKMSSLAQHITFLSGGNQQKAILAKWLSRNPRLIILDEPTRGIDVAAKADIYQVIDNLANENCAVIMVSSEMAEILGISDTIMIMHEGRQTGWLENTSEVTQEKIMSFATGTSH